MNENFKQRFYFYFLKKVIKDHEYFGYSAISKSLRDKNML